MAQKVVTGEWPLGERINGTAQCSLEQVSAVKTQPLSMYSPRVFETSMFDDKMVREKAVKTWMPGYPVDREDINLIITGHFVVKLS